MSQVQRARAAILGALVADAASLGFHWLYDQERIRALAPHSPEFRKPSKTDYDGVAGYFAHGKKTPGELSQYGEQTLVMLRSLSNNNGVYSKAHYEAEFCAHFGYGGDYCGYIDHAIRETLDNMTRAKHQEKLSETTAENYHGADDVQLPALSKLPALVACYAGKPELNTVVESAIRVTNNNDTSVEFGLVAANMLERVILGDTLVEAMQFACKTASNEVLTLIKQAFTFNDSNNQVFTQQVGLACNLISGFPSIYHHLLHATSYQEAIRQNIYSGGDSCGRSIFLGAILGASRGLETGDGISAVWMKKLLCLQEVEALIKACVQK